MIPTIDGKTNDWDIVPESYVIGSDQLVDDMHDHAYDPKRLNVRVRVGWVKGLNRLYFLYEADKDILGFFPARFAQRHLRTRGGRRPVRRPVDRDL